MFKRQWQSLLTFGLGTAGGLLLRLLLSSLRWRIEDRSQGVWCRNEPVIIAFWHNRQLLGAWLQVCRRRLGQHRNRVYIMISEHDDGRMAAWAGRVFGIDSVAGSSTRGGRKALLKLIKLLRAGHCAAITPDGPRGPCYQAKSGAVMLAESSGNLLCPIALSAKRCRRFGSWDRMILPAPFSPALILVGPPLKVPRLEDAAEREAWRGRIEEALSAVTAQADAYWQEIDAA